MTTTYPTKGKGNRPTQWPAALIEEAHQLWLNPSWTIEGIATKYRVSPKSIVSLKERQGWPGGRKSSNCAPAAMGMSIAGPRPTPYRSWRVAVSTAARHSMRWGSF